MRTKLTAVATAVAAMTVGFSAAAIVGIGYAVPASQEPNTITLHIPAPSVADEIDALVTELGRVLPACATEDSDNCRWDAARQGNGRGSSVVTLKAAPKPSAPVAKPVASGPSAPVAKPSAPVAKPAAPVAATGADKTVPVEAKPVDAPKPTMPEGCLLGLHCAK